jgi:hypothetical protein
MRTRLYNVFCTQKLRLGPNREQKNPNQKPWRISQHATACLPHRCSPAALRHPPTTSAAAPTHHFLNSFSIFGSTGFNQVASSKLEWSNPGQIKIIFESFKNDFGQLLGNEV